MELPKDPMMLFSVINMKLRDCYSSLDELCEDMDVDKEELVGQLVTVFSLIYRLTIYPDIRNVFMLLVELMETFFYHNIILFHILHSLIKAKSRILYLTSTLLCVLIDKVQKKNR